jgi:hypothetical protein
MGWLSRGPGYWRGVFLTLVVLALAMKVIVPPGFMLASDAGAPRIAVCTGHGAMAMNDPSGSKAPAHKTSDTPCAFAGSVTPPAPALVATIAEPLAIVVELLAGQTPDDLAPGRGLAAPPPQSHAPPSFPEAT